jgi:hypothetical protein
VQWLITIQVFAVDCWQSDRAPIGNQSRTMLIWQLSEISLARNMPCQPQRCAAFIVIIPVMLSLIVLIYGGSRDSGSCSVDAGAPDFHPCVACKLSNPLYLITRSATIATCTLDESSNHLKPDFLIRKT